MTGPRFVDVPADRLLDQLRLIGDAVTNKGGGYQRHVVGRETVVDVAPPGAHAMVRIYTSLADGASRVRDVGEDAVRICLLSRRDERPLGKSEKILRTAPARSADRVQVFLERLTARIRARYAEARAIPGCGECGGAMVLRLRGADGARFYGCSRFRDGCRGTRPYEEG